MTVPNLYVSRKVLLKHQVNWNTVCSAIQYIINKVMIPVEYLCIVFVFQKILIATFLTFKFEQLILMFFCVFIYFRNSKIFQVSLHFYHTASHIINLSTVHTYIAMESGKFFFAVSIFNHQYILYSINGWVTNLFTLYCRCLTQEYRIVIQPIQII